ncbi:PepSY domain-containing protein [Flammeovirga aprica]|uniref:PepSY domain-containing protein n=1 Tax=Flammeovirga aprica JL-4 TaxID=694437 RepID=A0A7X9P0S6_9BACT|nr:PepSY domain-containing protein [Flammeovirga aprica]NME66907.1 PepSY domain-containing protein [Flammeovirga aprica JL-4]
MIFKKIYKKAVSWHKYIGLFLSIILVWMSVSGILLNHPDLIATFSIPKAYFPDEYIPENWNRGGIQDIVYVGQDTIIIGGKQGVWKSNDSGKSFQSLMHNGFPEAIYYQKVNDLYYDTLQSEIYVATFGGIYKLDLSNNQWTAITTPNQYPEKFVKVINVKGQLYAVSQSHIYSIQANQLEVYPIFKKEHNEVDMIQFTFALHSGWLWGTPGRLFYDFLSLILIFLSLTSLYITFFKKKKATHSISKKIKQFIITYHTKIGVWTFLFLLIIGGTGMFMRPPLIVALYNGKVPSSIIPDRFLENEWYHTIRNALYDPQTDRIILDTTEGIFAGKSDGESAFEKQDWKVNIFVMGATVFEPLGDKHFLVGSFYGLYDYKEGENFSTDALTHEKVPFYQRIQKPGDFMTVAAFTSPKGEKYISAYSQGLLAITPPQEDTFYHFPKVIQEEYKLPLWNYMFELHNGRLFQFIFDKYSILLIPVLGLLFNILLVTGLYEYLYRKRKKIKKWIKA